MQGQKTLLLSYNMHLFVPYLLNDSQLIRSRIHFSKPTVIGWFNLKQCLGAFNAPKAAPSGKEQISIFIQTNVKTQVSPGLKRLGIRFKNNSFHWFRVEYLFWETISLYTVHFQI